MSVPVTLRQHPAHVKQSAYFPVGSTASVASQQQNVSKTKQPTGQPARSGLVPLSFPASNTALWDKTPTGLGATLHIAKERNLYVHILEKTLRLAYRHASQQPAYCKCFLIGQALTNADDDGVTVTLDRFDPGHEIPGRPGSSTPTAKLPGDHVVPLTIAINKEFDSTTHTEEEFKTTFQLLQHHCSSREAVDVANLVSLRLHCCCYANDDDITFSLHVAGITIATSLNLTPINAVPIIPTALARNLQGPLNLSEVQGTPKSGFVTLDQTRKLLLLLESDPKAYSLPLVGIWMSGISYIGSPVIWAACLRYMFNGSIQERVCNADEGFLVIIYSPSKRKPEFYQCSSDSGDGLLSFQLIGCRENLHVFKHADVTNHAPIQLELRAARDGPNKSVFLQACKQFQPLSWNTSTTPSGSTTNKRQSVSRSGSTNGRMSKTDDDIQMVPRPSPKPIMDKSPTVRPSVPELSLIFDSFEEPQHSPGPSPTPYIGQDDVFLPQDIPSRQPPQPHPHHQKENPPQSHVRKPGHLMQDRARQMRPGPLRQIDQNSPHIAGGSKSPLMESQPRQPLGSKYARTGAPVMARSNSEPSMVSQQRLHGSSRNSTGNQQHINPRQNTSPLIGQEIPSAHVSANVSLPHRSVPVHQNGNQYIQSTDQFHGENFQGQNTLQGMANPRSYTGEGRRRASAPIPRQDDTTNVIGQDTHKRQSLPNGTTPYRYQQHQPGSIQSTNPSQQLISNQVQYGGQNRQPATPQNVLQVPVSHSQPNHVNVNQRSDSSVHPVVHSTMDVIPEGRPAIITKPAHNSSSTRVSSQSVDMTPHVMSSPGMTPYQSPNTNPNHVLASGSPHTPNAVARIPSNPLQAVNGQHHAVHNVTNPSLPNSQANSTQRTSPAGHADSSSRQDQRGLDDHSVHSSEGQGSIGDSSTQESLASQDAYVQLRRQEQMIRELQAQIQMLLQAQQTAASIPAGFLTPPATPTSTPSANQTASTPISHSDTLPCKPTPANDHPSRPVNHHSPPTRLVPTTTSPPKDVKCSIGVNTGQSLFWPSDDAVRKPHRSSPSDASHQKPTHQSSPQHSHPATKDKENSTFDLDSEPSMSLIVEGARDETHSGISMIGPIEMDSSLDTDSRLSSQKQSPERGSGDNDPSRLSDSFRSPVLGESASTCRPPGRPLVSSDSDQQSDSDQEGMADNEATGAPSLLYKDQRKFYANILGNVQQLLNEPTKSDRKQPADKSSSSSDSTSTTSSSEDSEDESSSDTSDSDGVAIATKEDKGLLGLKLSLPEDFESGSLEKSVMYRSVNNTSPDFFPRINYVSIMDLTLDSPNLSMEANALAMKYLSDEELAKLSVGFKSQAAATPRKDVNPLLRTALVGNMMMEKSMMGVSSIGFPAVDMSLANRKYMEKYGLLEIGGAKEETPAKEERHSPKKKTKKKKSKTRRKLKTDSPQQPHKEVAVKIGSPRPPTTDLAKATSPAFNQNFETSDRIRATPTLHPDSQQVSPISQTGNETYEPWLNKPPRKTKETNNGDFKAVTNQKAKESNFRDQDSSRPVGNILDISRLQELPKLL